MKCIKVFLAGFFFFALGFGVWAQDIDDEEEQQPEFAKTVQEKIILPIQPPKPKPTPIEIQPIEPKAESKQRFVPPSLVTPPEREQGVAPTDQFWFKQPSPVTAPTYQHSDSPTGVQFQRPAPVIAPDYYKQPQSPNFPFRTPSPVNVSDYHNPGNPQGVSSISFKQPSLLANIPPSLTADYKSRMSFRTPHQVQGASSQYSTAILQDFRGGLNKVDFPNKIADNEATEQQNFIWSPAGKLEPRPGFDKYNTTEITVGHKIYGLYPYYRPDTNKILLVGASTHLFADTTYSGSGTFIMVASGLQYEKDYYFETFKGKAIVVHEGDYPFWYDGESTQILGQIATGKIIEAKNDTMDCIYLPENPDVRVETWFTIPQMAFVEEDRFVSYTVGLECGGVAGGWIYEFVTKFRQGVEADTIFTQSVGICWPEADQDFKLLANFSKGEAIDSGIIDSTWFYNPGLGVCGFYNLIFDFDKSWSQDQYARYIVEVKEDQEYKGHTRYIHANTNNALFISHHICDSIEATRPFKVGVEYRIRKLDFYTAHRIEIYKNRIFLVAEEQDPNLFERIVFTKNNDLNDFHPDNFIPIRGGGGDKVTILATFYDDQLGYKDRSRDCLVIFMENSIYKLVWNSATDYYLVHVAEGVGCVAPRTVVNVEGKYILFLHTTGVYAFDGRTVTLVSKKIQPTIETLSKNANIFVSAAGYHDRHYYLSYPTGSAPACNETMVFNVDLGSWATIEGMKSNLYVQQTAIGDSVKLLFASSAWKTFIYEFGNATTDTGQAISLVYKSKAFDFNSIAYKKRFTYFDIDYNLTSGNFSAYFYTNFGDSLRYNKTVLDSVSGYQYKRLPLDADCLGRNFSFKITSSNHLELGKVGLKFKKIGE